jgi:hypothetical protein
MRGQQLIPGRNAERTSTIWQLMGVFQQIGLAVSPLLAKHRASLHTRTERRHRLSLYHDRAASLCRKLYIRDHGYQRARHSPAKWGAEDAGHMSRVQAQSPEGNACTGRHALRLRPTFSGHMHCCIVVMYPGMGRASSLRRSAARSSNAEAKQLKVCRKCPHTIIVYMRMLSQCARRGPLMIIRSQTPRGCSSDACDATYQGSNIHKHLILCCFRAPGRHSHTGTKKARTVETASRCCRPPHELSEQGTAKHKVSEGFPNKVGRVWRKSVPYPGYAQPNQHSASLLQLSISQ